MATVGFVIKTFGAVVVATRTGGSIPFKATLTDGTNLGQFNSVREAQKIIEAKANRLLRWTLETPIDGTERYRGDEI
jgi:hypothetical protein